MSLHNSGELHFLKFDHFDPHVIHGVFTRRGGVSPVPWNSLNLGGTVGDEPAHVRENQSRLLSSVGRDMDTVYDVWQVHGKDVVIANAPRSLGTAHIKADAILTDRPGLTLLMRFADCVPILFHDPVRDVVGIVHAGWLGTVHRVVQDTVRTMQARYGSKPEDIRVGIGPSIGPDHYEIGRDVVLRINNELPEIADYVLRETGGHCYFDLWLANSLQLQQVGVKAIEISEVCTACHTEDWFSHRAEKGHTGRFGAIIGL